MTREPQIAQQANNVRRISTNQEYSVSCRAIVIRNRGTDIVYIDNEPVDPGDVLQLSATWDGVLCYRMQIVFAGAEGKTQEVWLREISDIGNITPNK